ncbi:hypothetical protein JD844_029070 [Phrynosoma platyrhinos]|uniref:Calponin-homology (CH) domain-containing protein n=1 Tax=Phrynosoma platyrhinos TaxID=52577 RepID=A0ABQ7SIQ5_PHRPL|nr:hypothetical protein JD844_029070 [Phrynosoma platyrhinos]
MPATEKDLAEDAPWKKIQQNTFTRWCNEHLKCVHKRIGDLQKDLSDGLKLIALLEVLSQKKMYRKYHARPNFRQMKLENVSVALEFLDREHIKLVSIDSKAIVDGNLKLILGLIWTLILHYSISMPMWEDEDEEDAKKQTPKQRLLGWIQNKVPQLPITNFNRDWQDGKALGALVDNCAPAVETLPLALGDRAKFGQTPRSGRMSLVTADAGVRRRAVHLLLLRCLLTVLSQMFRVLDFSFLSLSLA